MSSTNYTAGGNTKTPAVSSKRVRNWFITLNNPTEEEKEFWNSTIPQLVSNFAWQVEKGEEGTVHIQGVLGFSDGKSFSAVKKLLGDRYHLEPVKALKQAVVYCHKEEGRVEEGKTSQGWRKYLEEKKKTELVDYWEERGIVAKPWQTFLFELVKLEPEERRIYWFWEETGNSGKSTWARKCILDNKEEALIVSGKGSDIFSAYKGMLDEGKMPRIVILDIPRVSKGFISWPAIEQIKNGLAFSQKYESGMLIFNIPHLIVFANEPPPEGSFSKDRICVHHIGDIGIPKLPVVEKIDARREQTRNEMLEIRRKGLKRTFARMDVGEDLWDKHFGGK